MPNYSPSIIATRETPHLAIKLICSAHKGRAGCLTDGKTWDFVYLKPARVQKIGWELEEAEGYEVYATRNLGAQKKEEIKRIMGVILAFSG